MKLSVIKSKEYMNVKQNFFVLKGLHTNALNVWLLDDN